MRRDYYWIVFAADGLGLLSLRNPSSSYFYPHEGTQGSSTIRGSSWALNIGEGDMYYLHKRTAPETMDLILDLLY